MDRIIKPVIFFSHSSHDAAILQALKAKFADKTGGTISVFLSSDGQSIPFGRNWVAQLEDALKSAKVAFIFITQSSVKSLWIAFEAGIMYARDIKVIPIGFLDYDLSDLSPPLSLLQGFNIKSWNSLNNIIQIVNDEFGHKHKLSFQEIDFEDIIKIKEPSLEYNAYSEYVSKVWIPFKRIKDDVRIFKAVSEILAAETISYYLGIYELVVPGISLYFPEIRNVRQRFYELTSSSSEESDITIREEPRERASAVKTFYIKVDFEYDCPGGLLDKIFAAMSELVNDKTFELTAFFDDRVEMIAANYLSAARLANVGIKLDPERGLVMGGFEFGTASAEVSFEEWHKSLRRYVGDASATCSFSGKIVPINELRGFVNALFQCGVLRLKNGRF